MDKYGQLLFYIFAALTALLTIYATWVQSKDPIDRRKLAIILSLTFLTSVLTVLTQFYNDKSESKRQEDLENARKSFQNSLRDATKKISQNVESIVHKESEISRIQITALENDQKLLRNQLNAIKYATELSAYTSGGPGNKPFLNFMIVREEDSTFTGYVQIFNFGKYPLSNVFYEFQDYETIMFHYLEKSNHDILSIMNNADAIMNYNKYRFENQEKTQIVGTVPNIPKQYGQVVHKIKIAKNTPMTTISFRLSWNNQNYSGIYYMMLDKSTMQFQPSMIMINDEKGKRINSFKEFFPTAAESYFTHLIPFLNIDKKK